MHKMLWAYNLWKVNEVLVSHNGILIGYLKYQIQIGYRTFQVEGAKSTETMTAWIDFLKHCLFILLWKKQNYQSTILEADVENSRFIQNR